MARPWRYMRGLILALVSVLALTLIPHNASAKSLAIWDSLQGTNPKGYVLLMRHALAPGVGEPANFRVGDCSMQRNLNDQGRQDACQFAGADQGDGVFANSLR